MKRLSIYLSVAASLLSPLFLAQPVEAYVDERVELMSAVFRMINAEEYSDPSNRLYVEDIEKQLGSYKNHDVFTTLKKDRNTDGLGYDAVMSLAVNLTITKNQVQLSPTYKTSLDRRWNPKKLPKLIEQLSQFYQDSQFNAFYQAHSEDYRQASSAFRDSVLVRFNQEWYPRFYGKQPNEEYNVIIGYGNGGGNYGPRVHHNDKDRVYAILGTGHFEGRKVTYNSDYAPTLIHEFNHSFVNSILETKTYKKQLKIAGETIQKAVRQAMQDQAYGNWETIINESIVRAAVILYMKENGFSKAELNAEYKDLMKRRFIWTSDLVTLLEVYQNNRNQYPSLEDFYPEIVTFFQNLSLQIEARVEAYNKTLPKVKMLTPAINLQQDVEPSITQLIIHFDQPMNPQALSINYGSLGKEGMPIATKPVFSEDHRSLILNLMMKANTNYEFVLTGHRFESKEGNPLQNYIIKFKTKK